MNIEITENIVRSSLVKQLSTEFGQDYTYYKEQVPQNFKRPSFHVNRVVDVNTPQMRGHNYDFSNDRYTFDIMYFPQNEDRAVEEINNVLDRLKILFKYVYLYNKKDDQVSEQYNKVLQKEFTIEDNILHFLVDFNLRTVEVFDKNKVESMKLNESLKKEDD